MSPGLGGDEHTPLMGCTSTHGDQQVPNIMHKPCELWSCQKVVPQSPGGRLPFEPLGLNHALCGAHTTLQPPQSCHQCYTTSVGAASWRLLVSVSSWTHLYFWGIPSAHPTVVAWPQYCSITAHTWCARDCNHTVPWPPANMLGNSAAWHHHCVWLHVAHTWCVRDCDHMVPQPPANVLENSATWHHHHVSLHVITLSHHGQMSVMRVHPA